MLLTTILLWALNLSITKHILNEGMLPLTYGTLRYGFAALVFLGMALYVERTIRLRREDLRLLAFAALVLWLNQMSFVFALDATSASTIGLVLGAVPIFAALFGLLLRTERATRRFWVAALVSFAGVGLVALGSGGGFSSELDGILLGLSTAATWAAYSVIAAPLMRTYSPTQMSAIVLPVTWLAIAFSGLPHTTDQDWSLGWDVWTLVVVATLGPLMLTNVLWFRTIHRIGANRATLAANLQPFVAAVLAVALLSESLNLTQIAGGLLIAFGIVIVRRRARPRAT